MAKQSFILLKRMFQTKLFYVSVVLLIGLVGIAFSSFSFVKIKNNLEQIKFSSHASALFEEKRGGEILDEYIRQQMKICYENAAASDVRKCYEDLAHFFLSQFTLQEILLTFRQTESSPEIFSRCHEVTHYMGRTVYTQTKSVSGTFAQCDGTCHGGCYHGTMEQYLIEQDSLVLSNASELKRVLQNVCGKEIDYDVPRVYSECIHGLGHAMMFITGNDLPLSLTFCDSLGGSRDQITCYGGAFMENSSSSTEEGHPSEYLDGDSPLYPCTILGEKYLETCYQYQSSYFAELSKWDWGKVVALCFTVPEAYQEGCFLIIGSNQVGYSQNLLHAKATCDLITEQNFKQACTNGVVDALGGRYLYDTRRMEQFCALVEIPDQEACFVHVGNVIDTWGWGAKNKERFCSALEDSARQTWCLNLK